MKKEVTFNPFREIIMIDNYNSIWYDTYELENMKKSLMNDLKEISILYSCSISESIYIWKINFIEGK